MDYLNLPPAHIEEREFWRTFTDLSISGYNPSTPKWPYPRREWDLTFDGAKRTAVVDAVRSLFSHVGGPYQAFFWKEPNQTTREAVFVGYGTGSRKIWILPVTNPSTITIKVCSSNGNKATQTHSVNYVIGSSVAYGTKTVVFTPTAPGTLTVIELDYTNGWLTPIVRFRDTFQHTVTQAGSRGSISFSIVETKEEMPVA